MDANGYGYGSVWNGESEWVFKNVPHTSHLHLEEIVGCLKHKDKDKPDQYLDWTKLPQDQRCRWDHIWSGQYLFVIQILHQYWDFAKHDAGIAICHYGINNIFHMSENSKLSLERSLGWVEFDWRCYLPGQRACVSSPALCSQSSNVALCEMWLLLNPQKFPLFYIYRIQYVSICGKWEFKSDL